MYVFLHVVIGCLFHACCFDVKRFVGRETRNTKQDDATSYTAADRNFCSRYEGCYCRREYRHNHQFIKFHMETDNSDR